MTIKQQILKLAKKKKRKITIGILRDEKEVINSLKEAQKLVDILIVGKCIKGFDCLKSDNIEKDLVSLIKNKSVDGIVRGQGDALKLRDYVCKELGYQKQNLSELVFLANKNYEFIFAPNTNADGYTKEQKIKIIDASINELKMFDIKPKIGLLTAVRPGSLGRNKILDETYHQAEYLVKYYAKKGYETKNYNIELEKAIPDKVNIVVPVNGMVGNQVNKSLMFFGGFELIACPVAGIKENISEDMRNQLSFYWVIIHTAAKANKIGEQLK